MESQTHFNSSDMSTLTSDLFCRGDHFNAMASTVEDGREDPFSLLENSDVEKAVVVVDSDIKTDTFLDI